MKHLFPTLLITVIVHSNSLVTPSPITLRAGAIFHPKSATSPIPSLKASSNKGTISNDDNNNVHTGTTKQESSLPRELMPITMGVFAQMLGEGIALSSLPLYLTRLGAPPLMVGLAISCFSVAQMTFAPILVGLSLRVGRSVVLRICLAGAAASSLMIAFSGSIAGVIIGRTLAGVFAACVPVAQSGVTDILSKDQTALGLSRVSGAAQLGIVVGPAASAIFQEIFAKMGLPSNQCLPAVFSMSSLFALTILARMTIMDRKSASKVVKEDSNNQEQQDKDEKTVSIGKTNEVQTAQVMLRTITIIMGWTTILSNSIYGLFAPRFMGFEQAHLSASYSFAAMLMIGTQVMFPQIIAKLGAHKACTLGILAAGTGIGAQSLVRIQPFHTMLYMINRAGAAIADTSTATLVASYSKNKENRSRNLALLTSTRAAARIITPLLSSKLFELSCRGTRFAGSLPFVTATCFALVVSPFPTLLKKAEKKNELLEVS